MPQIPSNPLAKLAEERGMMGTLDIFPKDVKFQTQNRGERVYIKSRAHPIVNLGWMFNVSILIVLPVIITIVVEALPFDLSIRDYMSDLILLVIGFIYYTLILTIAIYNFIDWYYDFYLVTNQRIINIQFDPLKHHKVSEAQLKNIENVTESVIGIIPNLFNYGKVRVQTAGTEQFVFRSVPEPGWFRDVIMDLSQYIRGDNT